MFVEKRKKWIFPLVLLFVFIILVLFRLNGSSAGMYHIFLNGTQVPDPNLLAGTPRGIRSDEWMIETPSMISQILTGSTGVNHNIGSGIDLTVQNMPAFNWTLLFKPLYWGFYLLPLEYGFSVYWWGKALFLVIGSYFLALKLTKNRILTSILLSSGFLFSPFFQWWYSERAIEIVTYSSILLLFILDIIDQKKINRTIWLSVGIVYFSFALLILLYPGWQIPIFYVFLFTVLGYAAKEKFVLTRSENKRKILMIFLSVVTVAGLCLVFYENYQSIIEIIRHTDYPGQRFISGGGTSPVSLITGFYDHQLLADGRTLLPGMGNQSEAASFFLIAFLITPWLLIELIYSWHKTKKFDYLIFSLLIIEAVFIIWSVVGFPHWLAKYSLFYLSPPNRTKIGFGWLNYIIICVLLGQSINLKKPVQIVALIYSITCVIGFVALGLLFRSQNQDYLGSRKLILLIAFFIGLMVFLLIQRKAILFSMCILIFSLWSTISVNPIYQGLGAYFDSEINNVIQQRIIADNQKWVVFGFGHVQSPNYILANGGNVYNGSFYYPDMSFISRLDPENSFGSVYNRYGNILFKQTDQIKPPEFDLIYADLYSITINPCHPVLTDLGINNFVFNEPVDFPCLKKYAEVLKPNVSWYFYSNH